MVSTHHSYLSYHNKTYRNFTTTILVTPSPTSLSLLLPSLSSNSLKSLSPKKNQRQKNSRQRVLPENSQFSRPNTDASLKVVPSLDISVEPLEPVSQVTTTSSQLKSINSLISPTLALSPTSTPSIKPSSVGVL